MKRSGMTSITLQVRRSVASIAVLLAVPFLAHDIVDRWVGLLDIFVSHITSNDRDLPYK